jgi:ribosomal-protein-alanine N-acetyltransferase
MIALPFLRREPPALEGKRVTLRVPRDGDFGEWAALRGESRAFLEPWEPRWLEDELWRAGWKRRMRRYREDMEAGSAIAWLIFENRRRILVGGITLGNIRYGVSQSAQIGYWTGERHAGQGYMQDAVAAVLAHAFGAMRLHRVEAACIPGNARSIRVLEKAGFEREGLLRSYLRINGVWQDHYLYARIAGDKRAGGSETKGADV